MKYRAQVLHHALVFEAAQVWFIVSDAHSIIFALAVRVPQNILEVYRTILLHFVNQHLDWITSGNLPIEQMSVKGLSGRGYNVDIQSIQIHFGLWKQIHEIIWSKNKPLTHCSQIVPRVVASWNKSKVFIDVMPHYLLYIKIPFKSSSPILHVIVRFIMYLTVNGFLATQYGSLADSELFNDLTISYVDMKKKLAEASNLRKYVSVVLKDFQIPSYRERTRLFMDDEVKDGNVCIDRDAGIDFNNLPMDRKLDEDELDQFKEIVKKKRKKAPLFLKHGLARKIRLSDEYVRTNSMNYSSKGTHCTLCRAILKQDQQFTTIKVCVTCCVPLC